MKQFMQSVISGKTEQAYRLLTQNPHLILARYTFKDHSDLLFENITMFQYAVLNLDAAMYRTLLTFMHPNDISSQLMNIDYKLAAIILYRFENLIELLEHYCHYYDMCENFYNYDEPSSSLLSYLQSIAEVQKKLPPHFVNAYDAGYDVSYRQNLFKDWIEFLTSNNGFAVNGEEGAINFIEFDKFDKLLAEQLFKDFTIDKESIQKFYNDRKKDLNLLFTQFVLPHIHQPDCVHYSLNPTLHQNMNMLLEIYRAPSVTSFVKPELYYRTTTDKNNVRYFKIYESYESILQQPTNETQLPPSPEPLFTFRMVNRTQLPQSPEPMFFATVSSPNPTPLQQISRSCFGTRQQPARPRI